MAFVKGCLLSQLCGWQQSSSQNTLFASVNKLGFNFILPCFRHCTESWISETWATNFSLLYPCPEVPPSHCWQKLWHTHHVPQLCTFHPWSLCFWDGNLSLTKDSISPFMQSKQGIITLMWWNLLVGLQEEKDLCEGSSLQCYSWMKLCMFLFQGHRCRMPSKHESRWGGKGVSTDTFICIS